MKKETIGSKENYTHVRFHYIHGGKMTVNKFTHEYIYPDEEKKKSVIKIEYIIKSN